MSTSPLIAGTSEVRARRTMTSPATFSAMFGSAALTLREYRERSRWGEIVVYASGVGA